MCVDQHRTDTNLRLLKKHRPELRGVYKSSSHSPSSHTCRTCFGRVVLSCSSLYPSKNIDNLHHKTVQEKIKMAILLTGGAYAKTSQRIASLCREAKIPFLFASRRGDATTSDADGADSPAVRFDWTDADTYANPFAYSFPTGHVIRAVYMVMPPVPEPDQHVNAFIDYAAARGVKRFVLMAGTSASLGGPGPGKVWQHMMDKGVEWAVCRPTWFMGTYEHSVAQ